MKNFIRFAHPVEFSFCAIFIEHTPTAKRAFDSIIGKALCFLESASFAHREPETSFVSNKRYLECHVSEGKLLETHADLVPIGEMAPDVVVTDTDGRAVRLSEFRGKQRVVLVFYPGDNTPVCTAQLCRFRDDWSAFEAADTIVFGVNPASAAKHRQFADKFRFSFPLLVDAGGKMAAAWGCRGWFGMIRRTVYAIDKQGCVIYARRGNPDPAEILSVLRNTQDAP